MKKLVLLLVVIGIISCQQTSPNVPPDLATRASGIYAVQFLQVDNITVWSTEGANKLGLRDFYVEVKRLSADSVSVGRSFTRNGQGRGLNTFARVQLRSIQDQYQLTAQMNVAGVYDSNIINGVFYERTVNMSPNILLKELGLDSLVGSNKEVVIYAKK